MDLESEDDILQRNIDQLDRETPRCNLSEEDEDEALSRPDRSQFGQYSKNIWLSYGAANETNGPTLKPQRPSLGQVSDPKPSQVPSPFLNRSKFANRKDTVKSNDAITSKSSLLTQSAQAPIQNIEEKQRSGKEPAVGNVHVTNGKLEPRTENVVPNRTGIARHLPPQPKAAVSVVPKSVPQTSAGAQTSSLTAQLPRHLSGQSGNHSQHLPSHQGDRSAPSVPESDPLLMVGHHGAIPNFRNLGHGKQRVHYHQRDEQYGSSNPPNFSHTSIQSGSHHLQPVPQNPPLADGNQVTPHSLAHAPMSKAYLSQPPTNHTVSSTTNPSSPSVSRMHPASHRPPPQMYVPHSVPMNENHRGGQPHGSYPLGPPCEAKNVPQKVPLQQLQQRQLPPQQHQLPPQQHQLPPKPQQLPLKQQHLPPQPHQVPLKQNQLPPQQHQLPPQQHQLPPQQHPLPSKQQLLLQQQQQLPPQQQQQQQQLPPQQQQQLPPQHLSLAKAVNKSWPVASCQPTGARSTQQQAAMLHQRSIVPVVRPPHPGVVPIRAETPYPQEKDRYLYPISDGNGKVIYSKVCPQWYQDGHCQDCSGGRDFSDGAAPILGTSVSGGQAYQHSTDEILVKIRKLDMCWTGEQGDYVLDFTFADRHKEMTYAEQSEEGIYQRARNEVIRQPPPWHDEETDSVKNFSERKLEIQSEEKRKSESQENVCLSPPWNEEDESALAHENLVLVSGMKPAENGASAASAVDIGLPNAIATIVNTQPKKKHVKILQDTPYHYCKDDADSVRDFSAAPQQLEQSSRISLTPPWSESGIQTPLESDVPQAYMHQVPPLCGVQKTEGLITQNVETTEVREPQEASSAPGHGLNIQEERKGLAPGPLHFDEEADSVKDYSLAGARQQQLSSKVPSYECIYFTPPWISENNSGVQTPCCRHMSMTQLPVTSEKSVPSPEITEATCKTDGSVPCSTPADNSESKLMNRFRCPPHYTMQYGYQGTGFTPDDSLKDYSLAIQENTSRIPSSEQLCFTPPWVEPVDASEEKEDEVSTMRQELTLEEQRIIEEEVRITGISEAENKARVLREEMVETVVITSDESNPQPTIQLGKDSGFCSEQDKKQLSPDGQQMEDSEQTDVQVETSSGDKIPLSKLAPQQYPSVQTTTLTTTVTTTKAARKNSWSSGNSTGSNHTDISTVVNAPTSVPITAPGSPEPASDSALSDIEESEVPESSVASKGLPGTARISTSPKQQEVKMRPGLPQSGGAMPGSSHGDKAAASTCSTAVAKTVFPSAAPASLHSDDLQQVKGHPGKMTYDAQALELSRSYPNAYGLGTSGTGQLPVSTTVAVNVNLAAAASAMHPQQSQAPFMGYSNHLSPKSDRHYLPGPMMFTPHRRYASPNHHMYYSYDQPKPPPYSSCLSTLGQSQGHYSGVVSHVEQKAPELNTVVANTQVEGFGQGDQGQNSVGFAAVSSAQQGDKLYREGTTLPTYGRKTSASEPPPNYYHLYPGNNAGSGTSKLAVLQEETEVKDNSETQDRQLLTMSYVSMEPNIQSPPRAETIETASVVSFASMAASHQNLDSRADMVSSLLSMLGTHDKDDMAKTLLAMSNSPDSCSAMRKSGCVPLLIQLLHDPDYESKGINWEARQRAALALHNIVLSATNDRRSRREVRVLRLLEIIRAHSESVLSGKMENYRSFRGAPSLREHGPGPAVAAIMKLTFEEEHKNTICELGGLQAIAELLAVDYEVNAHCHDTYAITLRKYAGMALINMTYSDNKSKTLLCTMKGAIKAIIAQLLHTDEEDLIQVSAGILRNTSWRADDHSKQQLSELGAIRALMQSTQRLKSEAAIRSVLSAVWNLSAHSSTNKEEICSTPGSLQFLCYALNYRSPTRSLAVTENAGGILRNVSSHVAIKPDYRKILREQGALQVLISHLRSPSTRVVSNACGILWNLSARCIQDQELLWELGAVSMLKTLVNSKHKSISASSGAALRNLMAVKPGSSGTDTESHVSTHFRRIHTLPIRQKPPALQPNVRKEKRYKSLSKKQTRDVQGGTRKEDAVANSNKTTGAVQPAENGKAHRVPAKDSGRQFYNDLYRDPPARSMTCPNKLNPALTLYAADRSDIDSIGSSLGDVALESGRDVHGIAEGSLLGGEIDKEVDVGDSFIDAGPVSCSEQRQDGFREGEALRALVSEHVRRDGLYGEGVSAHRGAVGYHPATPQKMKGSLPLEDKETQNVHRFGGAKFLQYPVEAGVQISPREEAGKFGMGAHPVGGLTNANRQGSMPGVISDFEKLRLRQDSSSSNSSYSPENIPSQRYQDVPAMYYQNKLGFGEPIDGHPGRHRRSFSDSFSDFIGGASKTGHYPLNERIKHPRQRGNQHQSDTITDSEVTNSIRGDGERKRRLSEEKMFTDSELNRTSFGNFLKNSYNRYEKKVADYKQQQACPGHGPPIQAPWASSQFYSRQTDSQKCADRAKRQASLAGKDSSQDGCAEQKEIQDSKDGGCTSKPAGSESQVVSPLCIANLREHDNRMAMSLQDGGHGVDRSHSWTTPPPGMGRVVTPCPYDDAQLSSALDHVRYQKLKQQSQIAISASVVSPPKAMAHEYKYDVRQAVTRKSNETIFSSVLSSNEDVISVGQCDVCCQNNIWIRGNAEDQLSNLQNELVPNNAAHFCVQSASAHNLTATQAFKPIELYNLNAGSSDPVVDTGRHWPYGPNRGICDHLSTRDGNIEDVPSNYIHSQPAQAGLSKIPAHHFQGKGPSLPCASIRHHGVENPNIRHPPTGASMVPYSGSAAGVSLVSRAQSSCSVKENKLPKGEKKLLGLLSKTENLLKRKSKDKEGKKKERKSSKQKGKGDFQVTSL